MLERVAVASLPVVLEAGWAPALLLFDRIVVPDARYVATALHEIENPAVFSSSWDPTGEQTVAEVRLGLGYHLWPHSRPPMPHPFTSVRDTLAELDALRSRDLVDPVPPGAVGERERPVLRDSFQADPARELDERRLQAALRIARGMNVEVCTLRGRRAAPALTAVSPEARSGLAVRVAMDAFPIPSASVPLDDLLAFRSDPEVTVQLARFRSWIAKTTGDVDTLGEMADELLVARDELEKATARLDRRYDRGTLSVATELLADVADNVGSLKLGSAVKGLLSWQKVKMQEQEKREELDAHPLAFLRRLEEAFGPEGSA